MVWNAVVWAKKNEWMSGMHACMGGCIAVSGSTLRLAFHSIQCLDRIRQTNDTGSPLHCTWHSQVKCVDFLQLGADKIDTAVLFVCCLLFCVRPTRSEEIDAFELWVSCQRVEWSGVLNCACPVPVFVDFHFVCVWYSSMFYVLYRFVCITNGP